MNKCKPFWLLLIFLHMAFSAWSNPNLLKANQLFEHRSNHKKLIEAKSLYQKVIEDKKASLEHRREAMARYGRLAIFEGAIARFEFNINEDDDAAQIFDDCIEVSKNLSPKKVKQDTAEYTYWRAACIGVWAANVSSARIAIHIGKIKEMVDLIKLGQKKFKTYEQYGFSRMEAGLKFKSSALKIAGLYQPKEALSLINESLQCENDMYLGYAIKAELLNHMGKTKEAIETLDQGIDELNTRFSNNSIPKDWILENMFFLKNMESSRESYKKKL